MKLLAAIDILVTSKPHGTVNSLAVLVLRYWALEPLTGVALVAAHNELNAYKK